MPRKMLAGLIAIITLGLSMSSCTKIIDELPSDTKLDSTTENVSQSTSKWVNIPIFKDFLFFDADGDGEKDHVVQHDLVAVSGGHGGYELYVYERSDVWGYEEIFNSNEYLEQHTNMDIQIAEMCIGRIVFSHSATGYETEYIVDKDTYLYLFNDDGSPKDNPCFAVDTFKTVEIMDSDDGAEELVMMRQYCSIGWHANYIGDCVSLWKITGGNLNLIDLHLQFKS